MNMNRGLSAAVLAILILAAACSNPETPEEIVPQVPQIVQPEPEPEPEQPIVPDAETGQETDDKGQDGDDADKPETGGVPGGQDEEKADGNEEEIAVPSSPESGGGNPTDENSANTEEGQNEETGVSGGQDGNDTSESETSIPGGQDGNKLPLIRADGPAALGEALEALPDNTPETPYRAAVSGVNIKSNRSNGSNLPDLYNVLSRYVDLDLVDCAGDSLTNSAKNGKKNIVALRLGDSIISIAKSALAACTNLSLLTLEAIVPPELGSKALPPGLEEIRVPKGSVSAYRDAPSWAEWKDLIQEIEE
jgi:hypothetical protein